MRQFYIPEDGFRGTLYCPERDCCPGKALIVFGGSDGRFAFAQSLAERFRNEGLTALALAYWKQPGLPDEFREVPVDSVETAALRLRREGFRQIGLWGISKGGELALLAGSRMPGLISCVVAVSPLHVACQGFSKRRGPRVLNCSSWSWHGVPVPYARLEFSRGRVLSDFLRHREPWMHSVYDGVLENPDPRAVIPVEQITGPVLLLSAKEDAMWPSAGACGRVMARLEAGGFAYAHAHLCYAYGSHLLCPLRFSGEKVFQMERHHPEECGRAKTDSFRKTLEFLRNW